MAYHYTSMRFNTFCFNTEKERGEHSWADGVPLVAAQRGRSCSPPTSPAKSSSFFSFWNYTEDLDKRTTLFFNPLYSNKNHMVRTLVLFAVRACVHMYVRMYCMHVVCMYVCIVYASTYVYMCVHACVCVCVCVCTRVHMCACHAYTCTCARVLICIVTKGRYHLCTFRYICFSLLCYDSQIACSAQSVLHSG